ncbi:NAD(P)-dependent alcohol dehydrogenase [Nocardiopsis lucentensis]|uniref:NAD(P)-dependent alcohol dehydrogenase n=1 Tax=Nocardiopsis lucentensis TaxID=53441 RepID=UPI000345CABC|nr:NAD(P)-dependent alcohol dehydrogenase [Nocardiopsis lucentensis]
MRAIVQRAYGGPADVLEFGEVDRPEPGEDGVLLRVHASSVNPADWLRTVGRPYVLRPVFGLPRPKPPIPGKDVAGTVEAVGPGATRLRPGDEVYGELPGGAYAEYVVAAETALARKPTNLDFAEAAAVPLAGLTALRGIRDAGAVRAGHRVLVNGASGGVGTFAVQIARSLGAHVTGVCGTRNLDLVRSIGADEAVDYTREDFTRGERSYDVILDLVGNHPLKAYRRVLRADGVYVAASGEPGGAVLGPLPYLLGVMVSSLRRRPRMTVLAAKPDPDDLAALTRLIEDGHVAPVVDRVHPLDRAAGALADQGAGHRRGKTVLTVTPTAHPS